MGDQRYVCGLGVFWVLDLLHDNWLSFSSLPYLVPPNSTPIMTRDAHQFSVRDSGLPPSSKPQGHNHKHNKPAPSSPIIIRRRAPGMPTLTNLEGLTLHSPSTQIVGTPFDSTSKFEYPYPDSNSSSDPVSSAESTYSSVHPSPMVNLSPPCPSGSSFPFFSAPTSPTPYTVPGLSYSDMSSSSSSSNTSSTSSFTPVHTKLKPPANPPMPPSLVKKHHRRRKNSFEGQGEAEYDGVLYSTREEGRRAGY